MKRILAAALAVIMATSVMVSCGEKEDSSSKEKETTSSAVTEDSTADSTADSTSDASETEEEAQPKPISEMPAALANQETASFTFSTDMDLTDFVSEMAANDYTDDESHTKLTVEELEGVPMLRIQALDMDKRGLNYKVPKIQFNMAKLFEGHEDLLPTIFSIKMDVVTKAEGTITNDDGVECLVPAFFGGKFVTQPWSESESTQIWNELLEFGWSEWTSEWAYYELAIRPGIKEAAKYVNTTEDQYLSIMKWGIPNQADLYIANITFLDEAGNVIECPYGK